MSASLCGEARAGSAKRNAKRNGTATRRFIVSPASGGMRRRSTTSRFGSLQSSRTNSLCDPQSRSGNVLGDPPRSRLEFLPDAERLVEETFALGELRERARRVEE